jgi:UDP-2,3-diacylglucosamine pyrophosphatase LpxH
MSKGVIKLTAVTPTDQSFIRLMPVGDVHYGNKAHDKEMFEIYMDWLYENKDTYVLGMGDLIEGATKHSVGYYDQTVNINDQIRYIVKKLKPLVDENRVLGLIEGNHERRVKRDTTSLSLHEIITDKLGVKNLGAGTFLDLRIKNKGKRRSQKYKFYAIHGASGSYTPAGKMNACMRLIYIANVECYLMGHVHALDHRKLDIYDTERGKIILKSKHFVITGSYLKYIGGYAQEKAYIPSGTSGSPKIKLHADMHRISVSL